MGAAGPQVEIPAQTLVIKVTLCLSLSVTVYGHYYSSSLGEVASIWPAHSRYSRSLLWNVPKWLEQTVCTGRATQGPGPRAQCTKACVPLRRTTDQENQTHLQELCENTPGNDVGK